MALPWQILAPIIALAITFAVMQSAVFVIGRIRARDYRRFESNSEQRLVERFPIPTAEASPAEVRRTSISLLLDKVHRIANLAQTTYYNAVVRSASCLVLAFVALAFGTLRTDDWPSWANWLPVVLSWVDVIAILFVLALFYQGRRASQPWIAARANTEFLRQYQFVNIVFPSASSSQPAADPKTQFDVEVDRVSAALRYDPITDIATQIERFWNTRRMSFKSHALTDADLTADAVLVYLRRRVRRQLGWFMDSAARLEHIAHRRNVVLLWLYVIMAALAVGKHILFLYDWQGHTYLMPILLIVTGMSAAMTAYYINQNSRSLIHRYNTQQRFITNWLLHFNETYKLSDLSLLPLDTLDTAAKNNIRTQILLFEDMMIEELIDWAHITRHDLIELAP
jgi:hypothetical protein